MLGQRLRRWPSIEPTRHIYTGRRDTGNKGLIAENKYIIAHHSEVRCGHFQSFRPDKPSNKTLLPLQCLDVEVDTEIGR